MSDYGDLQERDNVHVDRAHAGKSAHVDLARVLPEIGGADKVEVDLNGNVIGGATQVRRVKMPWEPA